MADTLTPSSAFSELRSWSSPQLSIEARENLTMASFAAGKGKLQSVLAAVREAYGVELPRRPARVVGNGIAFVWAGPDLWLAIAHREHGRDLEVELETKLAGQASVVDQSDGRVVVRVSGPAAHEVLAKGVPIDLHVAAFGTNAAAITHASHIGIIMWQTDEAPTFEMAMFRSYADSLAHWLLEAAESAKSPTENPAAA